ncbi:MAG TPA: hypothetical protein VG649_16165, partial [Candidatus Angelobacter sp.]|nr:hypothetical protein [Candidatus Angelobacter sp.]
LVNEKSNECMDAVMNLDRLLLRCGTASLVDQAHFFADQADQEIAARLHRAADELKDAAERQNTQQIMKLSNPIASLIRQVQENTKGVERIDAARSFGGLLRDRAGTTS